MNDLLIRKVKIRSNADIEIHHAIPRQGGEPEVHAVIYRDKALEAFHGQLQALAVDAVDWAELPKEDANYIIITGVEIREAAQDGAERLSARIYAEKKLLRSDDPLKFVTPWKQSEMRGKQDRDVMMSAAALTRLEDFAAEAVRYVHGERAQGELFVGEEEAA